MSMHPEPIHRVPEETARVARAAFPKGNHTSKYATCSVPSIRMKTSRSSLKAGTSHRRVVEISFGNGDAVSDRPTKIAPGRQKEAKASTWQTSALTGKEGGNLFSGPPEHPLVADHYRSGRSMIYIDSSAAECAVCPS